MSEFLVHIVLKRPTEVDDKSWAETLAEEGRVGTDYRRKGIIQRIWRIPGTTANVGIWEAANATELHTLLSSLPAYPFMTIHVDALARHYLESTDGHIS